MNNTTKDLPDGWEFAKFEDELDIAKGLTYKSDDYAKNAQDGNIFLTLKSIEKGGGFNKDGIKYYKGEYQSKHIVQPGDLIIANTDLTRNGDIVGAPIIVPQIDSDKEYVISMDLSRIDVKGKLDKLYVYYLLSSPYFRNKMKEYSTGSTVLHLNLNSVKKITFPLPLLPQQKKIAQILSTLDKDIHKTDEIIKQAELLKKGLMVDLFTKGIGHTRFKQTKLGTIPEEWEVVTVKDSTIELIDGDRGSNYPKLSDFTNEGYCLFLNTGNLKGNRFNFENCNFITQEKDELLRKGKLNRHDLVLTTRGTVGNIAYYSDNIRCENIRINSGMLIIRGGGQFDQEYLYYLLQSPYIVTLFKSASSGSAQPQLPIRTLNFISIPMPNIPEQKRIVNILLSADKKIELVKNERKQLLDLKNGLMQDLLTGRRLVN